MKSFQIIDPHSIPWKRHARGVATKNLAYSKEKNQYLTLFKIKKGARLKRHRHPCVEWMYVLEGTYRDDFGAAKKGQLKINAAGSVHSGVAGGGCVLLVLWCGKHEII